MADNCVRRFWAAGLVNDSTEESELPSLADKERVRVAKKMMEEMHIRIWRPSNYSSPRFHLQWRYIESLALGEKFDGAFDYTCKYIFLKCDWKKD